MNVECIFKDKYLVDSGLTVSKTPGLKYNHLSKEIVNFTEHLVSPKVPPMAVKSFSLNPHL